MKRIQMKRKHCLIGPKLLPAAIIKLIKKQHSQQWCWGLKSRDFSQASQPVKEEHSTTEAPHNHIKSMESLLISSFPKACSFPLSADSSSSHSIGNHCSIHFFLSLYVYNLWIIWFLFRFGLIRVCLFQFWFMGIGYLIKTVFLFDWFYILLDWIQVSSQVLYK